MPSFQPSLTNQEKLACSSLIWKPDGSGSLMPITSNSAHNSHITRYIRSPKHRINWLRTKMQSNFGDYEIASYVTHDVGSYQCWKDFWVQIWPDLVKRGLVRLGWSTGSSSKIPSQLNFFQNLFETKRALFNNYRFVYPYSWTQYKVILCIETTSPKLKI